MYLKSVEDFSIQLDQCLNISEYSIYNKSVNALNLLRSIIKRSNLIAMKSFTIQFISIQIYY